MDLKKRIDKVLNTANEQVSEEVGTLLGAEISMGEMRTSVVSKEEFFESLIGKQILAKIDVAGEIEGVGCLVIGIKDAIRLGGTLIMLPDSELEEVVGREEYTEETEDSYGEIANIIAGSYTKVFEDNYPKTCRFIRKEQEVLVPVKVDVDSEEPVPNQEYYQVSSGLAMGDQQMGELHMLLPAAPFGLAQEAKETDSKEQSEQPVEVELETEKTERGEEGATGQLDEQQEPVQVKKKVDPVKHKKRLDRLLAFCEEKLSEELTGLLGVTVTCSELKNDFISKEEFFYEEVEGKQVIADMEIVGELQDNGYFSIGLKDAIHLGGVLVMLPPSELEVVTADEDFSDDLKDAYGEVANIVAGVYTAVFEEQYSEKIRLVRKEVNLVAPMKVDIDASEPLADQQYYMSSLSLNVDGKELGRTRLLLPANTFNLQQGENLEADSTAAQGSQPPEPSAQVSAPAGSEPTGTEEATGSGTPGSSPAFDVDKHQKRVDKLLGEASGVMQEEIAALLGVEISLSSPKNQLISKEDFFFDVTSGKQVMASFKVTGEIEERSYFFVSLKDAIHMGGVLIMLPPAELENSMAEEEFSEDCSDAYGEVANIIAGVYSGIFEEQYTKKIRFVKEDITQVVPMKVDVESDEPVPDVEYYLSSIDVAIEGKQLGTFNLLVPAKALLLDGATREAARQEAEAVAAGAAVGVGSTPSSSVTQDGAGHSGPVPQVHTGPTDILIVADDMAVASVLQDCAGERGFAARVITFQDNIRSVVTADTKVIYVVMRNVDEQAFSMIIKANTLTSLPLIAAGPAWTRSKVIKAVKYGVNDILLTPATREDVAESLENNLVSLAA